MSEDFDWGRYGGGDFIKFKEVGDTAIGTIVKVEHKTLGSGDNATDGPSITLQCDDGELRSLFASQAGLQALLAEKKPRVGDRIRIVYSGTHTTAGGFTAKDFTLDVKEGEAAAATAPAQTDPF